MNNDLLLFYYGLYTTPPELLALQGIPQSAKNHPEGDAYIHTLYVIKSAGSISSYTSDNYDEHMILMYAALCHDLGKATTTVIHEDGRITSYGHDQEGVKPTKTLLERLSVSQEIIDNVIPLVREHMAHVHIDKVTPRIVKRIARRLLPSNIKMWSRLVLADYSGRPPLPAKIPDKAQQIINVARELDIYEGIQE
jgi:tRNA nucleotidyltransferase (CCA-adding enzyme)